MHSGRRPREWVNECVDMYICAFLGWWSSPFFSISSLYPPLIHGSRLPSFSRQIYLVKHISSFHELIFLDSTFWIGKCFTNKKNMGEWDAKPQPPSQRIIINSWRASQQDHVERLKWMYFYTFERMNCFLIILHRLCLIDT